MVIYKACQFEYVAGCCVFLVAVNFRNPKITRNGFLISWIYCFIFDEGYI